MDKKFYMQKAFEQAQIAADCDEVPVGAVVVNPQSGEIVAEAYNLSEHSANALAHAELAVMNKACKKLQQNRLWGLDLYVTLEPCTMCAAAISFMRIAHLYYGAYDPKGGAIANGVKFYESATCHHIPQTEGGIEEQKCAQILKDFFSKKRKKNKICVEEQQN